MPDTQPPGAAGNPDPWSYPSEPIDITVGPAEPTATAVEERPRRRLPVFVAAVAAVVLVIGGAAYAGTRFWFGTGAQPEAATPSSVIAFARVDLAPGFGAGRNLNNLVNKFPQDGGTATVDKLKQGMFRSLGIDETAYREHVEPWFGDRAGIGLWLDDKQRPRGVITLAAKNESKARDGLSKLPSPLGFVVRDGYALVVRDGEDPQMAAQAASDQAARQSLADSAEFQRGVDWLPGDQTVLAWADLAAYGKAQQAIMENAVRDMPAEPSSGEDPGPVDPVGPLMGLPGLGVFPGMAGTGHNDLTGHLIVGAQAVANGVEVRFRGFGTGVWAPATPADARSTVDEMPADTAIAGAFRVGDLSKQLDGLGSDVDQVPPDEELKGMTPAEREQFRKNMREEAKQLDATKKALAALSGSKISIAATDLGEGEVPALIAAAETASAGQADSLADALKQMLGGDEVNIYAGGNKVEVRTSTYAGGSTGTLAGDVLYRETLAGAPTEASAVVYVDVQRLIAKQNMSEQDRREAKPIKAIGLSTGVDGADPVGLLRVVIK